jgi:hypothetical protein
MNEQFNSIKMQMSKFSRHLAVNKLTTRIIFLLKNMMVVWLIKQFHIFYGTWRFISVTQRLNLVSNLHHFNRRYILTPRFLKTNFNTNLFSGHRYPKSSFSLRVPYHVRKSPLLDPILRQLSPFDTFRPCVLKMHVIYILQCTSRSSKCSLYSSYSM